MADIFPEEITDPDLALQISKEIWKSVIKTSKEVTNVKIVDLKIKVKKDDDDNLICRHKYEFSSLPPQQLLGFFTSALEMVAERTIVEFKPREDFTTIVFSTAVFEPEEE